jgi:hypothetical protein
VFSYKIIKIKTQIIDNGTKKLIQPKRVKYLKQCRCFQILGRFKGDFFQDTSADNLHSRAPSNSNKSRSSTLFSPSGFSQHLELEETRDEEGLNAGRNTREKLNIFLASRDVSPIRTSMTIPWDTAAERTKRRYARKGKQVALAALEELAPQNSEILFSAIQAERQKNADEMDSSLLEAMVECYENCCHWSSRRQMLSIIADKVRFATLQRWLPDLSRYRYNIARHHLFLHGRGTEVPQQKQKRIKVSPEKLDHFLAFITSAKISRICLSETKH